jgi:DNA-binding winged helix-turn-helix (wHTH) protein/Tol biopolymer transport system component
MEQTTAPPRIYRFGPFELFVETAELRKDGVRLKLQGQPFQILLMLLQTPTPGGVVTRDALRAALWPADTFVDFEHSLNTAVKKLRQALGDDADHPRFIETLPRIGYRFLPPGNGDAVQVIEPTPPTSRAWWRSRPALLLVALAVVIGIAMIVVREQSHPPYLQISATKQLTFTGAVSNIETDGRRVYYFKMNDSRLCSIPVGGGEESSYATRFRAPEILHISPDGSTLLVKDVGATVGLTQRIWLLPTNGGPPRPLADIEAESAAWSPDGKVIAFSQHKAIHLTEDEGATSHKLLDAPGEVSFIRWSPDSQHLRFTVVDSETRVSSMWEARRNGEMRPVDTNLGRPADTCCGIWTRNGRHFLFRESRDQRSDYWIADESWWPFRSRKPVLLGGGGPEMNGVTASPLDNRLFVAENQFSEVTFKFDLARRKLTPFLPERSVQLPAFSADGEWVVFIQQHNGEEVLWRARSDGTDPAPLTDPKLDVLFARFSADGKRIALMGKWPDRPWKIYWISAEGGALHEINVPITSQADPNWMPDNQSILFGQTPRYMAEPDSPRAIYIHNLQSGSLAKVPGSEGWFSPRLSPDGRSFLALSMDQHKLALHDFATSQWRVLSEDPQRTLGFPSWSPDGNWAYLNTEEKDGSLLRIRIRDGMSEKLLSFEEWISSPFCNGWNVAPDGSILITCWRPNSDIYALQYE